MSPTPVTTVDTPDETTQKYKNIVKSNGITDEVSEVIVRNAGLAGEGIASITKCVTVKFSNPKLQPLNLFVKAHSSNPSHCILLEEFKAFDKEARFLTEYVSSAKELCKNNGLVDFVNIYPKCYYGDKEMIVLENLVLDKGFSLSDRTVTQGLDEATFALRTLAKHHAMGYAMIEEYGGPEKFFQKFKHFDFEPFSQSYVQSFVEPLMENGLATAIRILEQNNVEGKNEALAVLRSKFGKTYQGMMEAYTHYKNDKELLTLNHGDYWNNNMMFQRHATGAVFGHITIDFQVIRYNSPVLDIAFYFYTSVKPKVRRAHMRDLLKIYLSALRTHSKSLGHPIYLTYEELFLKFRKKFEGGFWFNNAFGPSEIIKDINIEEMGDITSLGSVIMELTQKWTKSKPDKALEMAKEIVAVANEYKQLTLG